MEQRTPEEVGAWLRQRRLQLNLNQDELPGVSPATVRKIELGIETNPRARTKVNLAQALGLRADAYDVLRSGSPGGHGSLLADDPAGRIAELEGRLADMEDRLEAALGGRTESQTGTVDKPPATSGFDPDEEEQ